MKVRLIFLCAALIATAIAFWADSLCPGALNEVNIGLMVVMYIVVGTVFITEK